MADYVNPNCPIQQSNIELLNFFSSLSRWIRGKKWNLDSQKGVNVSVGRCHLLWSIIVHQFPQIRSEFMSGKPSTSITWLLPWRMEEAHLLMWPAISRKSFQPLIVLIDLTPRMICAFWVTSILWHNHCAVVITFSSRVIMHRFTRRMLFKILARWAQNWSRLFGLALYYHWIAI